MTYTRVRVISPWTDIATNDTRRQGEQGVRKEKSESRRGKDSDEGAYNVEGTWRAAASIA